MTWTKEDELLLKELQERKQQYENTMADCVERAVGTYLCLCSMCSSTVPIGLIEHATEFRKVLEPFDKEFKA